MDLLMNKFKFIGNFVYKNNTSWYFVAFFFFFFHCNSLGIYTEGIFPSVFTDGYCEGIFNWKNSPQFTNRIFMSVCSCTFVFVNFLVVLVRLKLRFNSVATHPISNSMDKEFALASLTFEKEKPLRVMVAGVEISYYFLVWLVNIYIFPYIYYLIKDKRLRVFYPIAICIYHGKVRRFISTRYDIIYHCNKTLLLLEGCVFGACYGKFEGSSEDTHKKNVWHIKGVGQFTRNERRPNASTCVCVC